MSPLPKGPYKVGLIDPPWAFETYGNKRGVVPQRAAGQHYPVMPMSELRELPLGDCMAKDSVLLMWVVDSHLKQAITLGESWGFTYKTIAFNWCKTQISLGYWTRKDAEFCLAFAKGDPGEFETVLDSDKEVCLLFTQGKPKRVGKGVRQTIVAPRREHSRKPDEQYERIEALLDGPYLEVFSRTDRPGWTSWGNQTGKFNPPNRIQNRDFHDVI